MVQNTEFQLEDTSVSSHCFQRISTRFWTISLVPYDQNDRTKQDVIGNEIDLAFRLEKFADDTHFIINEGLATLLDKDLQAYKNLETSNIEFKFIACEKRVKGFEQSQKFYALCSIDHLRTTIENKKYSSSRDDITEELLGFVTALIPTNASNDTTQSLVDTFGKDDDE